MSISVTVCIEVYMQTHGYIMCIYMYVYIFNIIHICNMFMVMYCVDIWIVYNMYVSIMLDTILV